jgi:hypothetical protein
MWYMIMIWYINVYDGDDDVRGSKLGSIICLAQDDPQSHWPLRAQVGDRGAGCGGFSCMVFELTGSNVVRKLGKHDFWSKIEHHHVSWFSAFWVPFQRSQNWIGFRENSDRKSLTFGTKTSKNHGSFLEISPGFPSDFSQPWRGQDWSTETAAPPRAKPWLGENWRPDLTVKPGI